MISLKIAENKVAEEMVENDVDSKFKSFYKEKLSNLLDKAPSDASLFAQVSKIKKGYEGAIEIISSQRKFLARAIRLDPNELAFELIEQIYSQILKWRNDRILLNT